MQGDLPPRVLKFCKIRKLTKGLNRPLFNDSISTLESHFDDRKNDRAFLEILAEELKHRSTARAKKLKADVDRSLSALKPPSPHSKTKNPSTKKSSTAPPSAKDESKISQASQAFSSFDEFLSIHAGEEVKKSAPAEVRTKKRSIPSEKNAPTNILSAWTALEVLSPQTFKKPEDLANGDKRVIAQLAERCPWLGQGERSRPNYRLFYQVIIGTINFQKSVEQLLQIYADARVEKPVAQGEAVLAVVVLDSKGRLLEEGGTAISSFGWGLPIALAGDLQSLADWPEHEMRLQKELDQILRRQDASGEELPLTIETLKSSYNWLISRLSIPTEFLSDSCFAVRSYQYIKNPGAPDPILLNSFYLNDLAIALQLFQNKNETHNLKLYLGNKKPDERQDLFQDLKALEKLVAPQLIPPARWPGKGRHPLVLLQQASVNAVFKELQDEGIIAVNGPPGTGKTTLLRDIVASIITQRAETMCSYDDPSTAFSTTGEKLNAGSGFLHFYEIDEKLKGFEILITSSNNKAVENVSAEFPSSTAIADDAQDLRYFKPLSDALLKKESWGAIAAVLGNSSNRFNFSQTFWWSDDFGMRTYLAEAAGVPQFIEAKDPNGKVTSQRKPVIISECEPPSSNYAAQAQWKKLKAQFLHELEEVRRGLTKLESIRKRVIELAELKEARIALKSNYNNFLSQAKHIESTLDVIAYESKNILKNINDLKQNLLKHRRIRPGFFALLFNLGNAKEWKSARNILQSKISNAEHSHSKTVHRDREERQKLTHINSRIQSIQQEIQKTDNEIAHIESYLKPFQAKLGDHLIGDNFYTSKHEIRQLLVPWCNKEAQQLRDGIFISAMKIHKAFIDAAPKQIRNNIGLLMMSMSGRKMPDEAKLNLLGDLWATFFLVIPCVSTTFASVDRMLGSLPPKSLGWLLIDEAGQAIPQAAVGALMRTKKAVVVGDPIQIEPVVTLPPTLTVNICKNFGVDPDNYNAPDASVQTLADAATPYFAEFQSRDGSRSVGVPLLVHRRCTDPMFSISNAVAYSNLMVQSKTPGTSPIKDCLGESSWLHVEGSKTIDKWCVEEGDLVLSLLGRLKAKKVEPNLYIVTPFVIVAENIRRLIIDTDLLNGWVNVEPYQWTRERIGTVHTVQGREAEAVIFVLGAPLPQQNGARNWAGGKPNLLNVAVTRAKEVLYVVGNRAVWKEAGFFKDLASRL